MLQPENMPFRTGSRTCRGTVSVLCTPEWLVFEASFKHSLRNLQGMIAYVGRPVSGHFLETFLFAREQRAKRLFETRFVACHRQHEPVQGFLSLPDTVAGFVRAPRLVHQPPESNRGSAGLTVQPIPMPGEQGHFARHHPQPGPAGTAGDLGCRLVHRGDPRVHQLARRIVENQYRRLRAGVNGLRRTPCYFFQIAGSDSSYTLECRIAHFTRIDRLYPGQTYIVKAAALNWFASVIESIAGGLTTVRWTPGGVSDDIEDRRDDDSSGGGGGFGFGGFGGFQVGAGGMLVLLVLSFLFRRDLLSPFFGGNGGGVAAPAVTDRPDTARDQAEQPLVEFVSFVLDDAQKTWAQILPQYGARYQGAKLVLFRRVVDSACGTAQSATGPFYCPGDAKVYLDLSFFAELRDRFGAPGEFAEAYVIAHELGHHVQNLLGIESKVTRLRRQEPSQGNRLSVRTELQADCFAGIWGRSTERRNIVDGSDVEAGLRAAAAIGDDRLQRMATGQVMPEKFTHGSSAQRVEWFRRGLDGGDVRTCNTFGDAF